MNNKDRPFVEDKKDSSSAEETQRLREQQPPLLEGERRILRVPGAGSGAGIQVSALNARMENGAATPTSLSAAPNHTLSRPRFLVTEPSNASLSDILTTSEASSRDELAVPLAQPSSGPSPLQFGSVAEELQHFALRSSFLDHDPKNHTAHRLLQPSETMGRRTGNPSNIQVHPTETLSRRSAPLASYDKEPDSSWFSTLDRKRATGAPVPMTNRTTLRAKDESVAIDIILESEDALDVTQSAGAAPETNSNMGAPAMSNTNRLSVNDGGGERRGSYSSNGSLRQAQYAASIASSMNEKDAIRQHQAGCWPCGSSSKPPLSSSLDGKSRRAPKWHKSRTFVFFYRTFLISLLVVVPGIVLHFFYPNIALGDVEALKWLGAFAIVIFLYPFVRLLLHLFFYHMVPESLYQHKKHGNGFFYASELTSYLSSIWWLVFNLIAWNFVWPTLTHADIMQRTPLNFLNPILGILILWVAVLGLTRLALKIWTFHFHQDAFLERIREALFLDYIVEIMREAKRRKKFWQRTDETRSQTSREDWVPQSEEIKRRAKYITVPASLKSEGTGKKVAEAQVPERISAHAWKRLLDHFYHVMLMDEKMLEEIESDLNNYDEDVLKAISESRAWIAKKKANKLDTSHKLNHGHHFDEDKHHHLHKYHFNRHNHKLYGKQYNASVDDRAQKLAAKLFLSLKQEDKEYLSLTEDILPLFRVQHDADKKDGSRRPSRSSAVSTTQQALTLKQEEIATGVQNFFVTQSEGGRITERELRDVLQRSFRERKRLVSSLSGMRDVIKIVSDCLIFLFCAVLVMMSLSIVGVETVDTILGFGSIMVSFAFLFGASARNSFEAVIFLFFIHPYDVGDRIVVEGQNFMVSKINLLTTVMERWDGQLVYMPTNKLSAVDIYNFRRSKPQAEVTVIKVAFKTTKEKMDALAAALNEYVHSEPADFVGSASVSLDSFVDLETAVLKVYVCHRTNWQNYELYVSRRAKFNRTLINKMKEVGITWNALQKPVRLQNTEAFGFSVVEQ